MLNHTSNTFTTGTTTLSLKLPSHTHTATYKLQYITYTHAQKYTSIYTNEEMQDNIVMTLLSLVINFIKNRRNKSVFFSLLIIAIQ